MAKNYAKKLSKFSGLVQFFSTFSLFQIYFEDCKKLDSNETNQVDAADFIPRLRDSLKPLMSMAMKLGRMVTNLEEFLTIMLLDPLVTWSCKIIKSHDHLKKSLCEVTWQIKNIKFYLSKYPLSLNLSRWWLTLRSSQLVMWFWFPFIRFIALERKRLSHHRLLTIFLPAVTGALELKTGSLDFENFSTWRIDVVSSAFSDLFM